jgi:hypothetical protein
LHENASAKCGPGVSLQAACNRLTSSGRIAILDTFIAGALERQMAEMVEQAEHRLWRHRLGPDTRLEHLQAIFFPVHVNGNHWVRPVPADVLSELPMNQCHA